VPEGPGDFVFEQFHTGEEVLQDELVNTAWYTFGSAGDEQHVPDNEQTGDGKDAGTGDDQEDDTQDDTQDEGAGTGDEQQVPDNQQASEDKDTGSGAGEDVEDDTQEDVQDDQQGEMPEEMPETGAGRLAPGTSIPVGNAAAGLMVLIGAGYAVMRRR
jgi:hypothetical protein